MRKIPLIMEPDVAAILEKRRILAQDIQQVIYEARKSGQTVVHPRTGRVKARLTLFNTTVWVEYSPLAEKFKIHTAYCHRMAVKGGPGK